MLYAWIDGVKRGPGKMGERAPCDCGGQRRSHALMAGAGQKFLRPPAYHKNFSASARRPRGSRWVILFCFG
jgi:hypothetical protein